MNDAILQNKPAIHPELSSKSLEIGFNMPSDLYVGSLLRTLVSSKPGGNFLELGTGIGLSLSWMIDGMDELARLTTIDNDPELTRIATNYFGKDPRIEILCEDGAEWIGEQKEEKFDLIFADAWPGKYGQINEILQMLKIGGMYLIDDMSPQPNWPEGHENKVVDLIAYLENRKDLKTTKLNWSTGLVIAVKLKTN